MGISPYEGLYRCVLNQFEGVDCTVVGHSHRPYVKVRTGILLSNAGAVAPTPGLRHSVGTLDVGEMTTTGRIIYSQYF